MPIDRFPVLQIRPNWDAPQGDRYESHPILRVAIIQIMLEPDYVYVVSDQMLPGSVEEARDMVVQWQVANETREE